MTVEDAVIDALVDAPTVDERIELLENEGLLDAEGLERLLEVAASWMTHREPTVANQIAGLCAELGPRVDAPAVAPRATYVQAQGLVAQGRFDDALRMVNQARAEFVDLGLDLDAYRTSLGRSQILVMHGRSAEAEQELEQLIADIDPSRDEQSHRVHAFARNNLGSALVLRGAYEDGLRHLDVASRELIAIDERARAAYLEANRAIALAALGRAHEAIDQLHEHIATVDADRDPLTRAGLLEILGRALLAAGDLAKAMRALEQATELYAGLDVLADEQRSRLRLAEAQLALGLYDEAAIDLAELEHALRDQGPPLLRAQALFGLATARAATGGPRAAAEGFAESGQLFADLGHLPGQIDCRLARADLARANGDVGQARDHLDEAWALAQNDAWPVHRFLVELRLADLAASPTTAESHLVRAAAFLEATDLRPLAYLLELRRGQLRLTQGRRDDAVSHLEAAVDHIESTRGSLAREAHRRSFLTDRLEVYELLFGILVDLGDPNSLRRAFQIAEQSKSRALLDSLNAVVDRTAASRLDPSRRATINELRSDLDALYSQLLDDAGGGRTGSMPIRSSIAADLEARLEAELTALDDRDAVGGTVVPPAEDLLGATQSTGTTLVAFHIYRDSIHAFVAADGELELVRNETPLADVRHHVRRFQSQMERFRVGTDFTRRWRHSLEKSARAVLGTLHEALWRPIEDLLDERSGGQQRLLVVPEGALHAVPFHALWDGDQYLVDRFEIGVAPSAATWFACGLRPQATNAPIVMASPDESIPYADHEAAVVGGLIDGAQVVGSDVASSTVLESCARPSLLHLACHGLFRGDNPMFSALRLSDRWLTADEIVHFDLTGSVVVLSACESGRSVVAPGDESMGLPRAFLAAGATAVVASGWLVHDDATAHLMEVLYSGLAAGETITSSLRQAQLSQRAEDPHPFAWAPFSVVGTGDRRLGLPLKETPP